MGIKNKLIENFDDEVVEDFIDHLEVMSGVMEPNILAIQRDSTKLAELFRIFHNIKSASGFLQLGSMNKVSHLAEEILEEAKDELIPADERLIEWLLLVSDQFGKWSDELSLNAPALSPIDKRILRLP